MKTITPKSIKKDLPLRNIMALQSISDLIEDEKVGGGIGDTFSAVIGIRTTLNSCTFSLSSHFQKWKRKKKN